MCRPARAAACGAQVWGTKEQTEQWIVNEVAALLHMPPGTLSVRAHRVGVHVGHFIDVRVKVSDDDAAPRRHGATAPPHTAQ